MKKIYSIILCLCLFHPSVSIASKNLCPVATEKNIYGIWESVSTSRVFRLEINKTENSILSQGLSNDVSFADYSTSYSLIDGKIKIQFQRDNPKNITYISKNIKYTSKGDMLMEGIVRICSSSRGDYGSMKVILTMEPSSPDPTKWELVFSKSQKTLVKDIVAMEKSAKNAANKLKKVRR